MTLNLSGDFFDLEALNRQSEPTIWNDFRPRESHSVLMECILFLLDRGKDPNFAFRGGVSFLHIAVRGYDNDCACGNVMVRLIHAGADIHAVDDGGLSVTEMAYTYNSSDEGRCDFIGYRGARWDEALTKYGYNVALFHEKFPKTPGFNHIMDTSKLSTWYWPYQSGYYRWLKPGYFSLRV